MSRQLQLYFFAFRLGVESALVYRTNFLLRSLFNLLPLFGIISLWKVIYTDPHQSISGYTVAQMVAYYLLVTVIDNVTSVTEDDWQIANDIKDGHISQFLLRPLDYLSYRFSLFSAGRCVFTVAAATPVLLFLVSQRAFFVWPVEGTTWLWFGLSLVLSAALQFLLSFALAMLAFWVFEITSFAFVLLAMQRLLGGQMFPLDILPDGVARLLMFTPMPYTTFIPASIYLERLTGADLVASVLCQGAWVVVAYLLAGFAWRRGLRTYTSVGN